ncbi:MAG: PaaI family thioesterase [Verrucomicrobiota bacterium]
MNALPPTRHCFVCGLHNPAGFQIRLETDRKNRRNKVSIPEGMVRLPQHCARCPIATVLDEVMVWAVGVASGHLTYCAELNVRYQRPARPDAEVVARGELVNNRRDRLFLASASLFDSEGTLLSESTGKYLPVPAELHPHMFADFVGDPAGVFRPPSP